MTLRVIRTVVAGGALSAALACTLARRPSTAQRWQQQSCDPSYYSLSANLIVKGPQETPAVHWRLTNVSSYPISACRSLPFLVDLRNALGQPLEYSITGTPASCGIDEVFQLAPGESTEWTDVLTSWGGSHPIVSGEATLTIARSWFVEPDVHEPHCTIRLSVSGG